MSNTPVTLPLVLTADLLQKCFPNASKQRVDLFLEPLNHVLQQSSLNTLPRIQMFLAQLGHESGQLQYVEEIASGKAYEGRLDLGNTEPGDGVRYKGRGLIQVTGKSNYILLGLLMDLPLLEKPELLLQPDNAALSAYSFFENKNLWKYCDSNDFLTLTKRINGGTKGLDKREKLLENIRKVLQ